jgi:hypothetical protein
VTSLFASHGDESFLLPLNRILGLYFGQVNEERSVCFFIQVLRNSEFFVSKKWPKSVNAVPVNEVLLHISEYTTAQELRRQPGNLPKLYRIEQHKSLTVSNIWHYSWGGRMDGNLLSRRFSHLDPDKSTNA